MLRDLNNTQDTMRTIETSRKKPNTKPKEIPLVFFFLGYK